MKNKILILILCSALVVLTCACQETNEGQNGVSNPASVSDSSSAVSGQSSGAESGQSSEGENSHTAAEMAVKSVSYDVSVGGDLEIPYAMNDSALFGLEIDGKIVDRGAYDYLAAENLIFVKESYALSLAEAEHSAGIVTDDGTLKFVLKIKNTVESSFDDNVCRNYFYGGGDMSFSCSGGGGIKSVYADGQAVAEKYYAFSGDTLVIKEEFLEKLYKRTNISVTMNNNRIYNVRLYSDCIYATDYDVVTVYDDTESEWGLNAVCQDTKMMRIVDDGIDGRSIEYAPSKASHTMGEWAHAFFTIKDGTYFGSSILWQSVDFDNGGSRDYRICFDYKFVGATDTDKYTLYILTDGSEGFFVTPTRAGINIPLDSSSETVKRFDITLNGSLIKGMYIYADKYSDTSRLMIDNFSIRENRTEYQKAALYSSVYDIDSQAELKIDGRISPDLTVDKMLVSSAGGGYYHEVSSSNYSVTSDGILLKEKLVSSLFGNSHFIAILSDGQNLIFTVKSKTLFYSDYDESYVFDGTYSQYGANAFTNDSDILSITANGVDGGSLLYEPGKSSYLMGSWANRVMTLKNPYRYDFTWFSIAVDESKTYNISFDYTLNDADDNTFYAAVVNKEGPVYVDPSASGTVYYLTGGGKKTFSVTVKGDELWGFLIGARDGYRGGATMLIDNVSVREV